MPASPATRLPKTLVIVCLLGLGVGQLAGCSLFQAQTEVAALCAEVTDRNAGVSCIKAGYAGVTDAAVLTYQRLEQGRISLATARDIGAQLEKLYAAVELAEMAVFAGDLTDAQGRMDAVIALLDVLEGRLG